MVKIKNGIMVGCRRLKKFLKAEWKLVVLWGALTPILFWMVWMFFTSKPIPTEVEVEVIKTQEVVQILTTRTREEVDVIINRYRVAGNLDRVINYYDKLVKNKELTYLIIDAANLYLIPVNVLFALIYAESSFNPNAVNGAYNKDGSNDKGLMQLNSKYFKGFDRLDPRLNLQHGSKYLRAMYDKYGSWDEAVMFYNGFSAASVKHQAKVLEKERILDREFTQWFYETSNGGK